MLGESSTLRIDAMPFKLCFGVQVWV